MSCGRCENNEVRGRFEDNERRGRCEDNDVRGRRDFPCRQRLNRLKEDIDRLEDCLRNASDEGPGSHRRCHCRCCCCCRQSHGNRGGNQTSWGR